MPLLAVVFKEEVLNQSSVSFIFASTPRLVTSTEWGLNQKLSNSVYLCKIDGLRQC